MTVGLTLADISVQYAKAPALRGVTIAAESGSVTAVVGPNGAGKSSLLLAAYGSVKSTGSVRIGDQDVTGVSSRRRGQEMAIVPQGRQLFPTMSVRENLQVMADMLHLPSARVDEALDRFPVLRQRAKNLAGVLSGGEQQMLVVSRALMGHPKVLLLDETMTGLAPLIVRELGTVVRELASSGVTVIVAEPSIRSLHRIIDRGYVLIRGEIVASAASGEDLDRELERRMGFESEQALREAAEHEAAEHEAAEETPD